MKVTISAATAATVCLLAALTTGAPAQVGGVAKAGAVTSAAGNAASRAGGAIGGALGSTVGGAAAGVGGTTAAAGGLLGAAGSAGSAGGLNAGRGLASPSFSGPSGTIGASAPLGGSGALAGSGSLGGNFNAPAQLFQANSTASAAVRLELKQLVQGTLQSVSGSNVTIRQRDGTTRTVEAGPEIAAALAAYAGKQISLRSADGVHVTSFVGRSDVTRGIVTALSGDLVAFASPNGEVHSVLLGNGGVSKLHLRQGASVVATSNDFGLTASVATLNLAPASSLLDAYIGSVRSVAGNTVSLGVGPAQQTFVVTPATARALAALRGKTVALDAPDGVHVKSLLTDATVSRLADAAHGQVRQGAVTANVVSATSGRLTLQLPDGDLRSYVGNAASLHSSTRVPVTIAPLDALHVRVRSGARVANMADANACVTVNASCRASMHGSVVAATPTSLSVQYPSGDVATYVGNLGGLTASAGVPVTVTPLSAVSARVQAGAQAANLVDAKACVTINAGCRAMPGTVSATGPGTATVTLADGTPLALAGNSAGLAVNSPVFVQPLDGTNAIVQAGGQAAQLANVGACATLNAVCTANSRGGSSGAPTGTNGGSATMGVQTARTSANLGGGATPNAANPTGSNGAANAGLRTGAAANTAATGCVSVNGSNCTSASAAQNGNGVTVAARRGAPVLSAAANPSVGNAVASNAGNGGSGNNGSGSGNGNNGSNGNGSGANGNGGAGNGGNGGAGNGGNNGGGSDAQLGLPVSKASVAQIAAADAFATTCGQDGQIAAGVSDIASHAPVANARVQLAGPIDVTWHTDAEGMLRFLKLPAGTYRVTVSSSGYGTITSPAFTVDCTHAANLAFKLAAGKTAGSAVIAGNAPRLEHRAVASAAAGGAVCTAGRTTGIAPHGRRAFANARSHRAVLCSK
jgi:Carboxypeptidase regulatory-like domain